MHLGSGWEGAAMTALLWIVGTIVILLLLVMIVLGAAAILRPRK
jgi:hypothetical protein